MFRAEIAVFRKADGVLLHVAGTGEAPDVGDAILASAALPANYDAATYRWDAETRQMIADPARVAAAALERVDREHRHQHGQTAIAAAHARKAVEALLILAGIGIDGLVAAEARATGQDVAVLATTILANAAAAEAAELARITTKRDVRAQLED